MFDITNEDKAHYKNIVSGANNTYRFFVVFVAVFLTFPAFLFLLRYIYKIDGARKVSDLITSTIFFMLSLATLFFFL